MLRVAVLVAFVALAAAAEWEEGENEAFIGWTQEQKTALLGTKLDSKHKSRDATYFDYTGSPAAFPTNFTAGIDKWQVCKNVITEIKNQAQCGSCWAVAASEMFEDRWCIGCLPPKSKTDKTQRKLWFAAETLMSCCKWCGDGCDGGYPADAMKYLYMTGIPTGGAYDSKCGCQPYKVKPGAPDTGNTPACSRRCEKHYPLSLKEDTHKARDHLNIAGNAAAIQAAIMNDGPVECAFQVYRNFFDYKSGVYTSHGSSSLDGGHAIKLIGWGQQMQNGKMVPYWLINNSWGTKWGLSGQFKYIRGTNLGGMEAQCVAALPNCKSNVHPESNTITCNK